MSQTDGSTRYRHLFSPLTIRGRTFRNRVLSSGHAPGYPEGGRPKGRYQAYHEEKAKGGVGLSIRAITQAQSAPRRIGIGQVDVPGSVPTEAFSQFGDPVGSGRPIRPACEMLRHGSGSPNRGPFRCGPPQLRVFCADY